MATPFQQLPFDAVPEEPARPHGFWRLPEQHVDVWTEQLGDVRTSYRVTGQGPPLLLVHGLMTTGYSWRYALPRLSEHFTCYVPDLVGAGRTDKPDGRYTPEAVADWLVALQVALGIHACDVIGNSMGGYLCMWVALRHPDAMKRLVNLHSPGLPEARLYALWLAMRLPGSEKLLGALVRRDPERWAHTNVHYYDESLKSREEHREYGLVLTTPDGVRGFHRQLRDVMDVRALRRFAHVLKSRRDGGCDFPAPLLLLYATQDPMVSPRIGRELARLVRDAEYKQLSQASHFAHVDATDAFVDAAMAFFRANGGV